MSEKKEILLSKTIEELDGKYRAKIRIDMTGIETSFNTTPYCYDSYDDASKGADKIMNAICDHLYSEGAKPLEETEYQ